jgi:hypothetical protein
MIREGLNNPWIRFLLIGVRILLYLAVFVVTLLGWMVRAR